MEAGQLVFSDKKIKELNRKAKGADFDSHTHRYQQDMRCRNACDFNNIPEWLKWKDGTWSPLDGSDSRERHR